MPSPSFSTSFPGPLRVAALALPDALLADDQLLFAGPPLRFEHALLKESDPASAPSQSPKRKPLSFAPPPGQAPTPTPQRGNKSMVTSARRQAR